MNKIIVETKLQSMSRNLGRIKATTTELKNAEVLDEFLIDTLERNMEIINSIIEKMKNENNERDESLKHIKKF